MKAMSQHRLLIIAVLIGSACGRDAAPDAGPEEPPGGAVTLWTDSTELFMEYPGLIAGEPAKFNVHLTDLSDFAPLRSGRIVLRFDPVSGGEGFTVTQEAPRSPGIYGPAPQFPAAGEWNLTITVESPQARDVLSVPGLRVYTAAAEIPAEAGGGDEGISFLKEQQWKTEGFRTAFAAEAAMTESFDATGSVVPAAGRHAEVAAPIDGMIDPGGAQGSPIAGQRVRRGQVLVTLQPALGDAGSVYAEARGRLREAEEEYARAKRLLAAEAVSERRVHEAENRLQVAREALAGLTGGASLSADGRLPVRAPIAGVVTARHVVPGARVGAGDRLFSITDPTVVWLAVNLPASRAGELAPGSGAVFWLEGSSRRYQAQRMVSRGAVLDSLTRTLAVMYEVPNRDGSITIGANARAAVRTGRRVSGLVIPESAILDEDGRAVAYVQAEGERFEKRNLVLGGRDGERVLVVSGLNPGERVVTGAAYHVRLASLSTSVPAHGHEH
jgi:cobalt-zinc-cadmium efflux system membrane fusion protein